MSDHPVVEHFGGLPQQDEGATNDRPVGARRPGGELSPGRPVLGFVVRDFRHSTVLSVTGEVDIATTPSLTAALDKAIRAGGRYLVCDLTGVSFIGSSGLTAILIGHRLAEKSGVRLDVVCTRSSLIRKVIVLTGLDIVFGLHASVSDAIADQACLAQAVGAMSQ